MADIEITAKVLNTLAVKIDSLELTAGNGGMTEVSTAVVVRRQPAHRDAIRRPLRRRGHPVPPRRPAGGSPSLEGPAANRGVNRQPTPRPGRAMAGICGRSSIPGLIRLSHGWKMAP